MAFNLIDELSRVEKARIENYIHLYGTKENFIGIDVWLEAWAKNKIKLYKLLGNSFTYRTFFEYNKTYDEIINQMEDLLASFRSFACDLIAWAKKNSFGEEVVDFFNGCLSPRRLTDDEITIGLKFKLPNVKKTFQAQRGAKPLRALGRFLTYCKNVDGVNEFLRTFEQLRIQHSIILNDKTINANLVLSIDPIDYMTMSDNASNWQSCMSWVHDGCYHVGTVEMMNSNNVLCCYLEAAEPYHFNKENQSDEYSCPNKRWRQLIYITKDIIVGGKSYPYTNEDLSKKLIEVVRELADKNLHWHYRFGPELYQDMKWINGSCSMNRAKNYIRSKNTKKYNILFDSKGMYNDMVNDNDFPYWCVRNKVKHTKVISYSGKAPCLCCGSQVIYESWHDADYNERYENCGEVVCEDCLNEIKCDLCAENNPRQTHIKMKNRQGETMTVCSHCARDLFYKCPDCGKTMFVSYWGEVSTTKAFIKIKKATCAEYNTQIERCFWYTYVKTKQELINHEITKIVPVYKCRDCLAKDPRFIKEKRVIGTHRWNRFTREYYISKEIENIEDWEDSLPYNLVPAEVKEGDVIRY